MYFLVYHTILSQKQPKFPSQKWTLSKSLELKLREQEEAIRFPIHFSVEDRMIREYGIGRIHLIRPFYLVWIEESKAI